MRKSIWRTAIVIGCFLPISDASADHNDNLWKLEKGNTYCLLMTNLQTGQTKYATSTNVAIGFYYLNEPVLTSTCHESFEQNSISTLIADTSDKPVTGSHALLQSDSLMNELVTITDLNQSCSVKHGYTTDFRVTQLLIDALLNEEIINLTTHHERSGTETGIVPTKGFTTAYQKLLDCIESIENNLND